MNKKLIIVFVCTLWLWLPAQAQKAVSEQIAMTAIDQLFKNTGSADVTIEDAYAQEMGFVLEGLAEVWKNTGNRAYFDYIQQWVAQYMDEQGNIRAEVIRADDMEHIKIGRILFFLYQVTGKSTYFKASEQLYNALTSYPRTKEGGFWYTKANPDQRWLDELYVTLPFYTAYSAWLAMPSTYDEVLEQFVTMESRLRDPKTGLLYHGWDESRQAAWVNPNSGLAEHFWTPGIALFVMGLVDVLDHFPEGHPRREELIQLLNRTLEAVIKYQDKKTGVWYALIDQPKQEGNYLEASASSMFVYALATSLRKGYITPAFQKYADSGYAGLLKAFVTNTKDGRVAVKSFIAASEESDSAFDQESKVDTVINNPQTVGLLMLAASAHEFLQSAKNNKALTVTLDNFYNNEYKKDASGKLVPYHYLWDGQDLNGFSTLGRIFERYGGRLNTLRVAPTAQNLKNSHIYIIVDPDTEKETAKPNFMDTVAAKEIANWVQQGGVLVLLLNDAGNCEIPKFNILPDQFGIRFNTDLRNAVKGDQYEMGAIDIPAGTGIFQTTKKIYIKEISTMEVRPPAKTLVEDQGDHIIVTAKYGKGTVFAIGDPWLYNEYVDGQKLPAVYQNFDAANELVSWLTAQVK